MARPTDGERRRARFSWLPKSVLVTLFGAAVSAWLVPAFTRQWQDRQKEREIKVALVGAMGDATSDALVTAQFVANQALGGDTQREFTRLSLDWAKRSSEIDAKLRAYFPRDEVVGEWRGYAAAVQATVYLVTRDRGPRKEVAVELVRRYLRGEANGVQWALFRPSFRYDDPRTFEHYVTVSEAVLARREAVIDEVLEANAEGFSTTVGDLVRDLVPFA